MSTAIERFRRAMRRHERRARESYGPWLSRGWAKEVATEIRMDPGELELRRPLSDMGLDSVMSLVIRRRLEKLFRLPLPPTLLWNHPTVAAIAEFVTAHLRADEPDAPAPAEPELVMA